MEFRLKDVNLEVDTRGVQKIGGYINVTERESETLFSQKRGKWFKETMQKGVFKRAIEKITSVPLLLEHDWNKEVANTANGTLELREDNIGLRFDAVIDDINLYEEIRSGKINSCSFGFRVNDQEYTPVNSRLEKRYVKDITLLECSLVKNPAYVGSLVESRNLENALKEEEEQTNEVVENIVETTEPVETEVVEETTESVVEEVVEVSDELKEEERATNDELAKSVEDKLSEDVNIITTYNIETKENADGKKFVEYAKEVKVIEEVSEQREINVDTTGSDVKSEVKEVVDSAIQKAQEEAEMYTEMAKEIEVQKEIIRTEAEENISALENESLRATTMAYERWLQVAKLKQLSMKL